jgi:hypothetical protein
MEHQPVRAQRSPEMQQCIQNCLDCASICLESIPYCLEMGGRHAQPAHIRLLMACSEICKTSASYMLLDSPLHGRVCGVCAEVCAACARDCEQLGDDSQMQACAQVCWRCAESCRDMASHSA